MPGSVINIDSNFVGPLHWKSQRRGRELAAHCFVHSNKRKGRRMGKKKEDGKSNCDRNKKYHTRPSMEEMVKYEQTSTPFYGVTQCAHCLKLEFTDTYIARLYVRETCDQWMSNVPGLH